MEVAREPANARQYELDWFESLVELSMIQVLYSLASSALPLTYHSTLIVGSPTGSILASKWIRPPSIWWTSLNGIMKRGGG